MSQTTNYRLKKQEFHVGDTCWVLVKSVYGRHLKNPMSYECTVTTIGRKFLRAKSIDGRNTYEFDMTNRFMYRDDIYGFSRSVELFHSLQDLAYREEGMQLDTELSEWFNEQDFLSRYDQGDKLLEQYRLISQILDPVNGPELTHFLNECIRTREKIANGQLSVDSEGNVSIDDDPEYETFEQYFCYKDACISDGFDEIHKAIAHAVLHNYAYVEVHRYYRDHDRDNKIYPDGDPEIVWRNNDPLSVFKN